MIPTQNPPLTVQIDLHKLPRKDRLWLCEQMGYQPQHWGTLWLQEQSGIYRELKSRIQAGKGKTG